MRAILMAASAFSFTALPAQTALAAEQHVASHLSVHPLVERYLSWRGGGAFQRMKSFFIDAQVETDGLKGRTHEWRDRSGRTRDEIDLGATRGLTVRTPTQGWNKDEALVSQASRFDLEDRRRELAVEFGSALTGSTGARLERLRDERFDGRAFAVLRVRFGDADFYDLILDPATGALHGRRTQRDGRVNYTRLSDWRTVQGVRMPFLREDFRSNGKLDATVRVRSIRINQHFPASLFTKPQAERTLHFASGADSTGPIKYNPFTGTRIYIPAKVNGRAVEVLLDSGADNTVLDRSFAESIGKKTLGSSVAVGSGGEQESGYAKEVDIQIGNMSLHVPSVGVLDLASVGKRIGIPLPVVLGKEIFLQSIVEIDPSGPTIEFHDPATFQPPRGATEVPLEPLGSLRVVPVSVEGLPAAPMIFDLGNGGLMSLTPAYWQSHHLLDGRRSSTNSSGAVGGEQINHLATLRTITFAGRTFRSVPAEFVSPNVEIDSDREAGNVGMPLLGRFRMFIDFPGNRLFLIPIASRIDEPFAKSRVGMRLVAEGSKLLVRYVSAGSPAAAAGFKIGDAIVAIDGTPVGPDYSATPLSKWGQRPAGTVVVLTMEDGTSRKLTLADYY